MSATKTLVKLGVGVAVVAGLAMAIAWWPRASAESVAGNEMWTCSMHPQVRLPRPGACPICGMKLIPTAKLTAKKGGAAPFASLETQAVTRRELFKEIQTVGKIDYNESRVEFITARMAGRVDRLYVDFTGIEVKEHDHLVDIYSPELYSAQAELIRALEASEASKKNGERLVDRFTESNLLAARGKLQLWGLLPEQIAEIESSRKVQTHVTIFSPLAGTVIEKSVRLGQYIKEGDQLYRIAELDPIWLYLELYEYDIASVRYGQPVDVALEAFPGEVFRGIVTFIDPFLDDRTRTIKVRVNLKNPDRRLKAGMYASATIRVRLQGSGTPAPTGLEGKFSCPMHPEVIQDESGKCPVCKMDLILIPEGSAFADFSGHAHAEHDAHPEHVNANDVALPSEHAEHATDTPTTDTPTTDTPTTDTPTTDTPTTDTPTTDTPTTDTPTTDTPTTDTPTTDTPTTDTPTTDTPTTDTAIKETTTDVPSAESAVNPLAIPASAVLDTGRRQITYRATKDGNFELVELQVGSLATSTDETGRKTLYYPVLSGLNEEDLVVIRGGFLLDSQTQIEGRPSLLFPKGQSGSSGHAGHGMTMPTPMPAGGEHKH